MRLTTLKLTAFRSAIDLDLPLNHPRVLIAGLNGTGKTTCRESLKWLFLGRCDVTEKNGRGTDLLAPDTIRPLRVEVSAVEATQGTLSRVWNGRDSTFTVQGFAGSSTAQQKALFEHWRTDERFLEAVLDSSAFLQLHHAEAKALVLSLLNVQVKLAEDDSETYSLDELDTLYEKAFDARRDLKRDLQRIVLPARPEPRDLPEEAAVLERLALLRQALAERVELIGADRERRRQAERELARAQATLRALSAPEDSGVDLAGEIEAAEERLAILEADAETPLEAPSLPAGATIGNPADLPLYRRRADALEAHKPADGCVLDRLIPCKTARTVFVTAAKGARKQMAELEAAQPAAPVTETVSPITAVRRTLDDFRRQQQAVADTGRRYEDAQRALEAASATIAGLPDLSAAEAEIADYEARMARGEAILRETREHARAMKAFEDADRQRRELAIKLTELEQTVEALGPNGVRVQALAAKLGTFTDAVNAVTKNFGWTVGFGLDPWTVLVNGRPVQTYSRSEQYRIGIGIQLAVASLSGLDFAVVDEVDMLDVANRNLLTQMLLTAPIGQILVLATREAGQALPPRSAGILAYRLEKPADRTVVAEQNAA